MEYEYRSHPNRTLCAVIKEARKCCETLNFSYLPGLLEEIQTLGNRMEAGLHDKDDVRHWEKTKAALKKELNELSKQIEDKKEVLHAPEA